MGSGEHEQETQTPLALLGQREQKAMQIRKDILNATYAVIGLCVAAAGQITSPWMGRPTPSGSPIPPSGTNRLRSAPLAA